MARATSRLDLVVLAPAALDPVAVGQTWWTHGVEQGWWGADGAAAARAVELVPGGFGSARLHVERTARLWANQVGGFQVRCPRTEATIVGAFSAAMRDRTGGGDATLRCPSCGEPHTLASLDFRPPAGFARVAVELIDVRSAWLTPEAAARWAGLGDALQVIARRP